MTVKKKKKQKTSVELPPGLVTGVTFSGFQQLTYNVIDQTECYYIVKNEKDELFVVDKDKCHVRVIATSMIR